MASKLLIKERMAMKMLSINQVFLLFSLFSLKNMDIPNPHSLRMWKSSCAYLDLNFQWLARPFCPLGILVLASSGVPMGTEAGSKPSPPTPPLTPWHSTEPSLGVIITGHVWAPQLRVKGVRQGFYEKDPLLNTHIGIHFIQLEAHLAYTYQVVWLLKFTC